MYTFFDMTHLLRLRQAYAVMEEKVGEPEKARKLFKAGLERCPDHVHLHQVTRRDCRERHRPDTHDVALGQQVVHVSSTDLSACSWDGHRCGKVRNRNRYNDFNRSDFIWNRNGKMWTCVYRWIYRPTSGVYWGGGMRSGGVNLSFCCVPLPNFGRHLAGLPKYSRYCGQPILIGTSAALKINFFIVKNPADS